MEVILASASPRRRELLASAGVPFTTVVSDAPEVNEGDPGFITVENARRKGAAVAGLRPDALVLSADTLVYLPCEKRVLVKPKNAGEARDMLRALSGRWHEVYTGVCVHAGGACQTRSEMARILFDPLTEEAIDWYVSTGEPMDKAGAYAVQGAGGMFVRRVEGSFSCVVGLPMATVRELLLPYGLIK